MALLLNCLAALIAIVIGVLQFTHVFDHAWGRFLVLGLSALAATCIVTATLIAARESREQRRIQGELRNSQQELQNTLQQIASDLAAKPSGASPTASLSLKQRVAQLAEELFAFLKDKGPELPNPLRAKTDADYRQMSNAYFDRVSKIHYGYMAHFRDRVIRIDNELAEAGIFTKLEHWEVDPPQATREVNVQKIAETFLVIAAKMPDNLSTTSAAE